MGPKVDIAGDGTLPPDDVGLALPAVTVTVADWDRYELLELLGRGGMGVVYKARDRRLERTVAIKFIVGVDPNRTVRLLQEARAQARIDHPNICRVYEVGEVEGRAYIAIQFVAGEPLDRAAARMSVDDKAAVARDVAMAIQEAHRLGVIHRDLKPANILVEHTDDGRWCPIVMDFGLARVATVELGITESGVPLGTPAYMSPEQARGDVRAIDRRSDVYGLGATLFELLTGRPPFPSTSLAQALAQVIHDPPPAPRGLVPSLPIDLEIITLKCLAKDPSERYASARALAEDLSRYLAGEPIVGCRPSLWQRVRRHARRHRALVVLAAWSLAALVVVAGLGVRAWLAARTERARTAERMSLAQRLGQDAKEIELVVRSAYLLPLHDTRTDREAIRARMAGIAATRHDLGPLGDPVIHEALGRADLALHRWREAADELGRALDAGLHTPELHAARGQALGELYHHAVEQARRSGDQAWLAQRRRELAQQYLTPALAELAQSRASGDRAVLLEALVALYRGDFAAAERGARTVAERTSWLFEARKLAADAAYGAAVEAFDRGDYDAARPRLEHAAALYAAAIEVARSDASGYEAAAQTWLELAELAVRQGRPSGDPLDRATDLIDRALRADPDAGSAYTTRSYILLRRYRELDSAGDRRPLLERIAESATRATELDPLDVTAWDALGNAHINRGIYEDGHGGEGTPWWHRAGDELARALALEPDDPWANNDLAIAHRWLGDHLDRTGGDPMPEYQDALRGYQRATELDPRYLFAWSNQADLYTLIAAHEVGAGSDPRVAVEDARRAGERGLAVDPRFDGVIEKLAEVELVEAQYLVERGGDPSAALASARSYLARAEAVQPGSMVTWFYRLTAAGIEAKQRLRDGGDPTAAFAAARAALAETRRRSSASPYVYLEAARLGLLEAGWAAHTGGGSAALLRRARDDAEQAIALDPQLADAKLAAAEVYAQLAAADRSRTAVDRGMRLVNEALERNPRLAHAQAVRAQLSRLRAP